ncbi:hypothetical protein [Nonomuraea sp. bgisy101]|uniref:hypothetical protein n=1 Tax=Nonomuraea sp. bgisy101 TaxID=3413784 RepID=UPI003D7527F4
MANEVEIVITSKDKSEPGMVSAMRRAKQMGADVRGTLTKTGKEGGEQFAAGVDAGAQKATRSILGRARDARGRFVKELADAGKEAGDQLAAGVEAGAQKATRSVLKQARDASGRFAKAFTPAPAATEREGRGLASRLLNGISWGLVKGSNRVATALQDTMKTAAQGVAGTPILGSLLVGAIVGAIMAAGPAVGAALAGALTFGIGGAVTGIGVALLAQNKKVKAEWTKTWTDLKTIMTDASKPLLPVLDEARKQAKSIVSDLAPEIGKGFKQAQEPLKDFVANLGDAFKELKPAIGPAFDAFGQFLSAIGPQLPGLFSEISDSVITLSTTVTENKDLISMLLIGLLRLLPAAIEGIAGLTSAFRSGMIATAEFVDVVLAGVQSIMEVVASIPGPWQESAASIAASIAGTRHRLGEWRQDIENFPKIVKLEGEIRDLDRKLASARKQLKDPNLTKTRRAVLKAEIASLLASKKRAQDAINSLRGKVVTVTVRYTSTGRSVLNGVTSTGAYDRAKGGVIGGLSRFASGGVSGASGGSLAMVGEQGPEIVRLPFGSSVVPAGQTRAMTQGFGSISMAFRSGGQQSSDGGGLGGGLGGISDTIREVLSFREAMDKLTASIFGQERALSGYEAAWDAAKKSLKDNKKTLNISTEKGRENRAALLSLAEAAQEVVVAMREQGRASTTVIAKMREQRAEFIKMARSMGLSKSKASALADRYGLTTSAVRSALKTSSGKATGGVAGGWTLTGERGPELIRLPFGSQVTPAGQTAAMMAGGGGGWGGDLHITLNIGKEKLGELIIDPLRKSVRTRGGNVQAVLGSR